MDFEDNEFKPTKSEALPVAVGFTAKHLDLKEELLKRVISLLSGETKVTEYTCQEVYSGFMHEVIDVRAGQNVSIRVVVRTST